MSVIDFANLPTPQVIEELAFDTTVSEMQADLIERFPSVEPVLQLESALLNKLIQVFAYRDMLMRARVNDAARSLFLAYAEGSDLDGLGANVGVKRLIIVPEQNGQPAVMEDDLRFLRRIQLEAENRSGGRLPGYVGGVLSEFPDLIDAGAWVDRSNIIEPIVRLGIVSASGAGEASNSQITAVQTFIDREDVRQATDVLAVQSIEVVPVAIDLTLYHRRGPDPATVRANATLSVASMLASRRSPGRDVPLSAITAAATVTGVERVTINQPTTDLFLSAGQIASQSTMTVTSVLVSG